MKSDMIHPNAAGYQKMADRVLETIQPILEERARIRREGVRF